MRPELFDLLMIAVKRRLIVAHSAFERIEDLISNEIRRLRPQFRRLNIHVPWDLIQPKKRDRLQRNRDKFTYRCNRP